MLKQCTVALSLTTLFLMGCGSEAEFSVASVRGTVTHQGEPVAGVDVIFSPIAEPNDPAPGKGASGHTDSNGQYELSTYADRDGAVVGRHRVMVAAPDPNNPLPGQVPDNLEFEVAPGSNQFDIELLP